jgi:hypothetical protein
MTPDDGTAPMTLDEAVAAVEATLGTPHLRVDRRRARQDSSSYLLVVLDTSGGRSVGPIDNGPRLVDRRTGAVTRLTVPDAVARAERMGPALP